MAGGARADDGPWARLAHLSNELFSLVDLDTTTRLVSPSVQWVLGYSPEEFCRTAGLELVHPDDHAEAMRTWFEVIGTPGAVAHGEYRVRHKNGAWRWFELDVHNLAHEPDVEGIACRLHDITDLHHARKPCGSAKSAIARWCRTATTSSRWPTPPSPSCTSARP